MSSFIHSEYESHKKPKHKILKNLKTFSKANPDTDTNSQPSMETLKHEKTLKRNLTASC